MADEAATQETAGADETSVDTTNETATESATDAGGNEGEAALGDAGKKALDAMKAKWKEAEAKAKTEAEARAALEAKIAGKEAEFTAQQEAQRVKDEALAAANERILKAEVRAAAKGKVADEALPDLSRLMDLSDIEVGADGEVDASQIARAIDDLIASKPYLAAQGKRFQGGVDGGARNGTTTSIDDQIAEATKAGNHQLAIALKQQRSAELLAKKS